MLRYKYYILFLLVACIFGEINTLNAQTTAQQPVKTVIAGKQYNASKGKQGRWGKHYRKEWTTPVNVKVMMLDTLAGGLTPYEKGGGRQSISLRLRDANGREYVLRSIDKTYSKALPEIAQGSFIEHIANDQVSMAHPYAAVTITPMAEAAKILHTNPQIIFIPKQPRLAEYNEEFGDKLYLFEERPDENWENEANLGNSPNIISTEKLLEHLQKDNDQHVDQVLYVRSRLFDFFIGDWGRHEDQWRWASSKADGETYYKPIPRDRDQAYTKFDGFLLRRAKNIVARHLQSFEAEIKHINTFNFPARDLDRRMANEVTHSQWVAQARELQQLLTDNVIESSVRQMPSEVFPISGNEIIRLLKSRRDHLEEYADEYYRFLAREVDIPGSMDNELFEVKRLDDSSTMVNLYKINKEGKVKQRPFYSRVFYHSETKEIRIYGLGAEDQYEVSGKTGKGIKLRLIGGRDKDKYHDASAVKGMSHKTVIYDNPGNTIDGDHETRMHLSRDTAINNWNYHGFRYNKKGFKPLLFYSNEDHIFVGMEYGATNFKWRKYPFASKQKLNVKYSINEKAFSSTYEGKFVNVIGKWDYDLYGNYDFIRWYNYYGLGNESKNLTSIRPFNRLRTTELMLKTGISRKMGRYQKISLAGFYQTVKVRNDTAFDETLLPVYGYKYPTQHFAGAELAYSFQMVNDSLLPTKGFGFQAAATYTDNLQNKNNFMRYTGSAQFYLPFTKTLGVAIRAGGATLSGSPEFYQYNAIGGGPTLRGFRRTRFFGKTTFYDQNELRWIKDVRSYIYNGKFGLLALYDIGRVWMPGEKSGTWHAGYGGALILAPYNRISVSVGYAQSVDGGVAFLRVLKIL